MQDRHRDELALDRRVFLRSGILLSGAAVARRRVIARR
jgi:hypothetical protein